MKENPYDNETFYTQYNKMPRSKKGLDGAGEWHMLQQMLPDFKNKRVLDLGCGFGWHCRYAAQNGAHSVLGIDLSEKMLRRARNETTYDTVQYQTCAIEDFTYPKNAFDVVISSLAFHYLENFDAVCANVNRTLSPGGNFVFSVEHPVFTAHGSQNWFYNETGKPLHWPVDHYFTEGARDTVFLGQPVVKYHKTLTTYFDSLFANGFHLTRFAEPQPADDMLSFPGMADELCRPMMMLISAVKIKE